MIVKYQFKLDGNCVPHCMNLRDICQWKKKQIQMWIFVSERGGLFLSFFPKAQSRPITDITSHNPESPSLVLVSNGNSRCNYMCSHPTKLPLVLHKLSAFLWDGQNRNANTVRNLKGRSTERRYQICVEPFTYQPPCNIYLGSLLVSLHL